MAPGTSMEPNHAGTSVSMWKEVLFGAELLLLHASPVYYGMGVPRGDGSAVIIIPGFLSTDDHTRHLYIWLGRIGYRPYFSGVGINAGCPNLLVRERLTATVKQALADTGRRVHLIGHSLGGMMARSIAARRPSDIASVIALASPFRGTVAHPAVLAAAETIRQDTLKQHGNRVLSECSTERCTCAFVRSLRRSISPSVVETAIYTRDDGVVDWRYCRTGNATNDFEVPGTHLGMVFNPAVYAIIAARLSEAASESFCAPPATNHNGRGLRRAKPCRSRIDI